MTAPEPDLDAAHPTDKEVAESHCLMAGFKGFRVELDKWGLHISVYQDGLVHSVAKQRSMISSFPIAEMISELKVALARHGGAR